MGEKIKILSNGKILDVDFDVELNHPLIKDGKRQIHMQSDKFRIEMNEEDFIKYALSILVAEKNLKNLKDIV